MVLPESKAWFQESRPVSRRARSNGHVSGAAENVTESVEFKS